MKRELEILAELIRDWNAALEKPEIARSLVLIKQHWKDDRNRLIVTELILADGDIHRALQGMAGQSRGWLNKFAKWCDAVKGGAK